MYEIFAHKNVFDTIIRNKDQVQFDTYTLDLIIDEDPIHFLEKHLFGKVNRQIGTKHK